MILKYKIDNKEISLDVPEDNFFSCGDNVILSSEERDPTYSQKWYKDGYSIEKFLTPEKFKILQDGIRDSLLGIIMDELLIHPTNFKLDLYHKTVRDDKSHYKIVSRTRDLFPTDFNFNVKELISELENILGLDLTDINPINGEKTHIIVRINRPNSDDYNPPHKDIYESLDRNNVVPNFINFWIPICGVNLNSSLPIAKGSHLIPESKIFRTIEGGKIKENKYRVRMIKEWNGENSLERTDIKCGEILIFTPHLIHGLAINNNDDITRIALEFRLFSK